MLKKRVGFKEDYNVFQGQETKNYTAGDKSLDCSDGILNSYGDNCDKLSTIKKLDKNANLISSSSNPSSDISSIYSPVHNTYDNKTVTLTSPNSLVFSKIENVVEKMQDEATGLPVKTVKNLLTKIPSVFTGADLIQWMMKNLIVEDSSEALHLAHLLSCYGYIFPIDDHALTIKNDGTYYRFQTPFYWPSNITEPENTDYAVYLCKRTMQNKARLELVDYEAENLARLQKLFSRKWEFIYLQAEAQAKVDKKRDKLERKVLDSQERAFWDVYRPVPGSVNIMEADIKKSCRVKQHGVKNIANLKKYKSVEELKDEIQINQRKLNRGLAKISKISEFFMNYCEQYAEHDPFLTPPEPSNPWISDNIEYWENYGPSVNIRDLPFRRIKKWTFSLKELVKDNAGREQFMKFLEKEYSGENLKFYEDWKKLKTAPAKQVAEIVQTIYDNYFSTSATFSLNIDCKSENLTRENMKNPSRNTFDEAAEHIYQLMKSDSYNRFIRSDLFKDILASSKKKVVTQPSKSILPKISSLNKSGNNITSLA
ncbi:unnamed protein product [Gordionus sp. m RMFG-2023]